MFSHDWHQYFSTLDQQGAGDFSYVAMQNESIIGAVCALPGEYSGEEYAGIPLQEYNVIICIYVHPEHKNRGICFYKRERHTIGFSIQKVPTINFQVYRWNLLNGCMQLIRIQINLSNLISSIANIFYYKIFQNLIPIAALISQNFPQYKDASLLLFAEISQIDEITHTAPGDYSHSVLIIAT